MRYAVAAFLVVFLGGVLLLSVLSARQKTTAATTAATYAPRFTATQEGWARDWLGDTGFYVLTDGETKDEFLLVRSGSGGVALFPLALYREGEKAEEH